jgi:hypothetical protein
LEKYEGLLSPGLVFASGHCFWLFCFETSPTQYGAYRHVWWIAPGGRRSLFIEPEPAGRIVEGFHDFAATFGAKLNIQLTDPDRLIVELSGQDGTELRLELRVGQTLGTRALNVLARLIPKRLLSTSPMLAVSELALRVLMRLEREPGRRYVNGHTERGRRYVNYARQLLAVTEAAGTLNGEALGALVSPEQPLRFGDIGVPNRPFVFFGEMFVQMHDA